MKRLEHLNDLLDYEACKFHVAEIHLMNILPNWIEHTESYKLKSVLEKYYNIVREHSEKLEKFILDEELTSECVDNQIIDAYIRDTGEKLNICQEQAIKEAALLASVQSITHFKISAYGSAAAFANALNKSNYASIFHEIEVNEKQIDDRLSQLAEFEINIRAKAPDQTKNLHANGFSLP